MTSSDNYLEEDEMKDFVNKNYHFIRECKDYKTEYKSCKSLKGRFHQYFIDGVTADCSIFKDKWKKCEKCYFDLDNSACKDVINLEIELKNSRLKKQLANDVWTRRQYPPDNWNKKLPDYAEEKQKASNLTLEESDFKCIIC